MAKKIHKTFESFVANKDFKFEPAVIDPILNCIKGFHVMVERSSR